MWISCKKIQKNPVKLFRPCQYIDLSEYLKLPEDSYMVPKRVLEPMLKNWEQAENNGGVWNLTFQ